MYSNSDSIHVDIGDIDIDTYDRDKILDKIEYVCATLPDGQKHNTGIYVQNVSINQETGYADFDYKSAPNDIQKIDILNFKVLSKFLSNHHLDYLISIEPDWTLLQDKNFVENCIHINKWYSLISNKQVNSVDRLAMFLGLIRPSKSHLQHMPWNIIENEIWNNNNNDKYFFKKSHAYGYALTIVALMNLVSGK